MICAEHMQIVTLWSFSSTSAERKVVLRCLEYLCHLSMKAIGPEVRAEAAGWSWKASEAGRRQPGPWKTFCQWRLCLDGTWNPGILSCTPPTKFNIQIRYLNLKRMNLKFLVGHAGCLTVRLTERSTVRLTSSLFVTVRLTERSTMRLTVRQRVRPSVRQGVRHDKIRLILIKYGLFWVK